MEIRNGQGIEEMARGVVRGNPTEQSSETIFYLNRS
jgi:hypothetical protein